MLYICPLFFRLGYIFVHIRGCTNKLHPLIKFSNIIRRFDISNQHKSCADLHFGKKRFFNSVMRSME